MEQSKLLLWLAYWYQKTEKFEFEWDLGNSQKSLKKHQVSTSEIESVFKIKMGVPLGRQVSPHVQEERFCLVAPAETGKMLSVVFALRNGHIDFDTKEIIAGLSRLKGARRKPTSIALE